MATRMKEKPYALRTLEHWLTDDLKHVKEIDSKAWAVLCVLIFRTDPDTGQSFPGYNEISHQTRLHKKTVERAIHLLAKLDIIKVEKVPYRGLVYTLNMPLEGHERDSVPPPSNRRIDERRHKIDDGGEKIEDSVPPSLPLPSNHSTQENHENHKGRYSLRLDHSRFVEISGNDVLLARGDVVWFEGNDPISYERQLPFDKVRIDEDWDEVKSNEPWPYRGGV